MGFYVDWSYILKSDFKSNPTYIIQNKIYEVEFGHRSKLSLMLLEHVILPLKKKKQIFEEWNGNLWNINFLWTQKSFTLVNLLIYYTNFLCFLPIFFFFPWLPWSVFPFSEKDFLIVILGTWMYIYVPTKRENPFGNLSWRARPQY